MKILLLALGILMFSAWAGAGAEPDTKSVGHRLIDSVTISVPQAWYDDFVEYHEWNRTETENDQPEKVQWFYPSWKSANWTARGYNFGEVYVVYLRTVDGNLSMTYFEGYPVEGIGKFLDGIALAKPSAPPLQDSITDDGSFNLPVLLKVFPRIGPIMIAYNKKHHMWISPDEIRLEKRAAPAGTK